MAKIVMGVAMVAGAIALQFIPGVGQLASLALLNTMGLTSSAAAVFAAAPMMLGTMGAGLTLSSIAQAMQGGGQALSQSIRNPMGNRTTIYGQTRVGGTIVYESCIGYVVNQVVAWASHRCASVDFLYLDGREVYFTGHNHQAVAGAQGWTDEEDHYDTSGNRYNFYARGSSNYHLFCWSVLGSSIGSWITQLGAGMAPPHGDNDWGQGDPNWDSSCTLNGICATYVTASSNVDMWNGIPNPKAAIHGKCDIYDPRLGAQFLGDGITQNPATHIWTDNAALIVADHLCNHDYGVACDWDEIGIDQLIVAANICDEQVELAGISAGWKASWSVTVGTQILDPNGNIETVIGVTAWTIGETGLTQPTWPTSGGATVRDGSVTWQMSLLVVTASWAPYWTVPVGQQITDPYGNIETASATTMGDSTPLQTYGVPPGTNMGDSSLPDWSRSLGGTVPDGNITWTMSSPATYTTPVTRFESRYTINGSFDWSASPGDILDGMLAAMEARISYQGGVWKIYPAAWYGSTLDFGMGDLTGPMKWLPKRKLRELNNAVRATFVCPSYPYAVIGYDKNHKDSSIFDGQYQPTDAPEYAQDALHGYASDLNLAADGGRKLYTDVRYQYVTSVATCQRLMKIRLLRNRQQGSGTLQMSLSAYKTCPQDVIRFTAPIFGWVNKNLEVNAFRFVPKAGNQQTGGGITLSCELDVSETDPSVYTWSAAEERSIENSSSPKLLDSLQVVDPTGLTLESGIDSAIVGLDGIVTPRINATWIAPADPFTTSGGTITIQFQHAGDTAWQTAAIIPGTQTQCYIRGVICAQTYNVRICSNHASGASGNWVISSPHAVSTTLSTFSGTIDASAINTSGSITAVVLNSAQGVVIPDTTDGHIYKLGITNGSVKLTLVS